MKMLVSGAVAVVLLVGVAVPANAQSSAPGYSKEKKHRAYRRAQEPRASKASEGPYYEHLANKLPIGSSRWFEQMEREGRFGNRGG